MKIILVCRSGGDYRPQHANWLMQQLPQGARVSIITDFIHANFIRNAHVIPLENSHWLGWWSKMELFRPGVIVEPTLYLDLDTVIKELPGKYFFNKRSVVLSDFYKPERPASGMMLIRPQDCASVWDKWIKSPEQWMRECGSHGDQAFIGPNLKADRWQTLYPKEIISYKAQCVKGNRFYSPDAGTFETAKIICFHGKPRPWESKQDWIPTYAGV